MHILKNTAVKQSTSKQQPGIEHLAGTWRRWFWKPLWLLLFGIHTVAYGQDKMKVSYRGEHLESDVIDGEPCARLTGDVVFGLEKCTIQADHAIYYDKKNLIEAQGHVTIMHEDGSIIIADQLIYDDEHHLAKLRGHVIYQSDTTTFYTDHFDYDMETKQGHFVQGGKLVEGGNTLTSESGQYNDTDKAATFHQKVTLDNEEYTVQCDTMHYNSVTKIAQFEGPTSIVSKDGQHTLTAHEGGEYNTNSQQSTFLQNKIDTEAYTLYGDLFRADKAKEIYTATGHVNLIVKEDDVTIVGDYGHYEKAKGTAKVYGNTLMTKILEEDTLYLSADTFVATESQPGNDNPDHTMVRAYHNVKIYKEDLQGKADAMVYQGADAAIYFHGDPIFWSHKNQLTADAMHILLQDKKFHEMHMNTHAFVVSEDEKGNYNQLQGRDMIAFFKNNKIDSIEIDGNAESIYFVIDNDGQLQGMNHLRCGKMHIDMEAEDIAGITFQLKPVGEFFPPHKIVAAAKKLKHFKWRYSERPTKREVVEHGYGTEKAYQDFKINKNP